MLVLAACSDPPPVSPVQSGLTQADSVAASAKVSASTDQRGNGLPYEIIGSQVWDVPDPVSGRDYQVFVALPASYADEPDRRYPVMYVTDAAYAFPLIKQIARRLNGEGPAIEEFILVGLSYAVGEAGMPSRRRDYTPTPAGASGAPDDAVHGQSEAYIAYLRDNVLPFVAKRFRTDEQQRLLLGHSYGGLLATQVLLTQPRLFTGYVLGSPSYWYDHRVMEQFEQRYADAHDDLPASVYIYVGEYEQRRFGKTYDMVSDARRMANNLRSRRYPSLQLQLDVLADEDHLSVAPRGFTHGLKYLLGVKQ
ncbi:alpha/beta hydrolase [Pseudoxanthomonas dokdonensis]|uniref:Esterase n=1 Tax=Pseudoxanthomonas dokdonensis TaxID=344882 RepID=A0A0R0CMD8_9GAMM|nr:esterase [Pseudoxanthomonas dokdonensis]